MNMINIRERKYEIGVFRTIGVSKFKLTMQFVLELLIVTIIMLIIGAVIGGKGPNDNMNIQGLVLVQAIDSIDAVVDFKVVGQLLGIGILLTLVSSIASMISIQRFSPLTILKERS